MTSEDKLVEEKLDVDNYATWSVRMKAYLMVKGLWRAVTGDDLDQGHIEAALAQSEQRGLLVRVFTVTQILHLDEAAIGLAGKKAVGAVRLDAR